mmetsp:Transcript_10832/g.32067  ORF Transcript_10832/g.32067 Transcript_10832/m.32067 type:complete len:478 (-) Transcript_10832:534-1967(-)|eukprot:CAMPEP_0113549324 /NCGR_PEP_ID=MMETSP0015_2-20120614/13372_1 /TAXON_ID=2838 /ORGANISM="Odontella" /LENGTH=477 /DNA_ID=CAMNT_0000450025 /DNA_START=113 /DNA_END=1546 /DNA_ORIENTATION=- /assembly_acc=CAM_ASM_000160
MPPPPSPKSLDFDIKVIRGRKLVPKDRDFRGRLTSSDPYVKIFCDGVLHGRTACVPKTLDPVWEEDFVIHVTPRDAERIRSGEPNVGVVTFLIMDRDMLSKDDNMGVVVVSLGEALVGGNEPQWYQVRNGTVPGVKMSTNVSGDLHIKISTPEPVSLPFEEVYNLGKELGSGAFSVVKEGTHKRSGEKFAIKVVTKAKLTREDELALLDEISILKDLRHRHIIRLSDVYDDPKFHYLVTEIMSGGELFDRIVAKSFYNEKEARDVCLILFDTLRYCHFRNVAHRDLKPENLLLLSKDNDSEIKIADFGFAKRVDSANCLTTQCGTPGYVAPEILEGVPYGTKSDMWSLGVIMYILLGGYPPFIDHNQRELFRKIRKGQYEFHKEYWGPVSKEAKDLISSLLTIDPRKRLSAEAALKSPWIMSGDDMLAGKDLGVNLTKLQQFNAKRKFRAAVKSVIAINKMNSLGEDFKANLRSTRA